MAPPTAEKKKDGLELARAISKCGCNNDDGSNHGTTAARDILRPGETVEERARSLINQTSTSRTNGLPHGEVVRCVLALHIKVALLASRGVLIMRGLLH